MGNLIVKSNAFVGASYGLGVVEQRLILLAILKARETDSVSENIGKKLTIYASDYMAHFDVDRATAYKCLENAVNGLYESEYRFIDTNTDGKQKTYRYRFVSSISYSKGLGCVELTFTNETVPLIVELSSNFTKYEIEQISTLQSSYAIRLYELMSQWKNKNFFYISLQELRFKFGLLDDEYNRMDNFKRKVLDIAVDEINKHTDLNINYEQKKQGRKIIGFSFTIKEKQKKKSDNAGSAKDNTIDMFSGMTDKQRHYFANKLSELPELSKFAEAGADYRQFAEQIANELKTSDGIEKYKNALVKVGFEAQQFY